jgi:hypothetical protein
MMTKKSGRMRRMGMMVICGSAIGLLLIAGCVGNKPWNPAATQPVTEVDLATTQPSYYWSQPEVASVQVLQFQSLWDACLEEARRYDFQIDRQDYRDGTILTKGLVSKQLLEPWRRDSGTAYEVLENSMSTISRTLQFQITHEPDGTYRAVPKVLVQRLTVLERRITSAIEYRSFFAGPASLQSRTSVTTDVEENVPIRYYTPLKRDLALERQIARSVEHRLTHQGTLTMLHVVDAK